MHDITLTRTPTKVEKSQNNILTTSEMFISSIVGILENHLQFKSINYLKKISKLKKKFFVINNIRIVYV